MASYFSGSECEPRAAAAPTVSSPLLKGRHYARCCEADVYRDYFEMSTLALEAQSGYTLSVSQATFTAEQV
jgi:hypothetical protein